MYVVYIDSEWVGRGDDKLGATLMKGSLEVLSVAEELPDKMMFVNSGIKLISELSESLEPLKRMEDKGVSIIACRTCLDYYKLIDKVAVGSISNTFEIINAMIKADKVIRI
jgi:selenium metabolism protein YedF